MVLKIKFRFGCLAFCIEFFIFFKPERPFKVDLMMDYNNPKIIMVCYRLSQLF